MVHRPSAGAPDPVQLTAWGSRRKAERLPRGRETHRESSRLTCSPVRTRLSWEEARVPANSETPRACEIREPREAKTKLQIKQAMKSERFTTHLGFSS